MNDEDMQRIDWRASEAERRIAALERQRLTPFELVALKYLVKFIIFALVASLLLGPMFALLR